MPQYALSVIICSMGRSESLEECLESLAKQSFDNFEVIIISDQSIKAFKNLTISWMKDPNKGLSYARDLGWRHARAPLVSWIDDDCVVSKHWSKELVDTFEKYPDIGGVSGPTIIPKELLSNRQVFFWYKNNSIPANLWMKFMLDGDPYQIGKITKFGWWTPGSNFSSSLKLKGLQDVDYLEACNMTLRRQLVSQVGGFDLKYKGTSEWCEVDLALRVKNNSHRLVFNPLVKVQHNVSRTGVYTKRNNMIERLINYLRFRHLLWKLA